MRRSTGSSSFAPRSGNRVDSKRWRVALRVGIKDPPIFLIRVERVSGHAGITADQRGVYLKGHASGMEAGRPSSGRSAGLGNVK